MINFLNIGKFDGKYVLITSNGDFAKLMVDSGNEAFHRDAGGGTDAGTGQRGLLR